MLSHILTNNDYLRFLSKILRIGIEQGRISGAGYSETSAMLGARKNLEQTKPIGLPPSPTIDIVHAVASFSRCDEMTIDGLVTT